MIYPASCDSETRNPPVALTTVTKWFLCLVILPSTSFLIASVPALSSCLALWAIQPIILLHSVTRPPVFSGFLGPYRRRHYGTSDVKVDEGSRRSCVCMSLCALTCQLTKGWDVSLNVAPLPRKREGWRGSNYRTSIGDRGMRDCT